MRKLCVGIDVVKSKFNVMYTIDGENYFGYSTFPNDKKGIKKFIFIIWRRKIFARKLSKENKKRLCRNGKGFESGASRI